MDRRRKCKRPPKAKFRFQPSSGSSVPIPIITMDDDSDEDYHSSSTFFAEPIPDFVDIEDDKEMFPTSKHATGPRKTKLKRKTTPAFVPANIGCKACQAKFRTFAELSHHEKSEHEEKRETFGLNVTTRPASTIQNIGCVPGESKVYNTRGKSLEMKNVMDKSFSETFDVVQKLHLKRKNQNWEFQCKICEKPFRRKGLLNEHMRTKHKIRESLEG